MSFWKKLPTVNKWKSFLTFGATRSTSSAVQPATRTIDSTFNAVLNFQRAQPRFKEESVQVNPLQKTLDFRWENGQANNLTFRWLRDHCQCTNCHHPLTFQRQIDTSTIPKDIEPQHVRIGKKFIDIDWKDNHKSRFEKSWLESVLKPSRPTQSMTWDASLKQKPTITYNETLTTPGLYKWLELINRYGFCLVTEVPTDIQKNKTLIEQIGILRSNLYGSFWDVKPNFEFSDTAYTNIELYPHTDGCYFQDPPGLQFFHMIEVDCKGGESVLVDGFNIAKQMREENPRAFQFLSSTPIPFQYIDQDHRYFASQKIFNHDTQGNLIRFNYNNDDRAPFAFSADKQREFYNAIDDLLARIHDPNNILEFKLFPGTLMVTNNWRVMHGRKSFDGNRRMIGCYINQEEYQSKLHTLRKQFSNSQLSSQEILD